ncbi:hypothetical protein CVCC1112_2622 [Paenarthrobacter nicotinovorans]|nr:hypothetical protein CVCC1112_2622 [Paenarthrobacter nicotinovorans]
MPPGISRWQGLAERSVDASYRWGRVAKFSGPVLNLKVNNVGVTERLETPDVQPKAFQDGVGKERLLLYKVGAVAVPDLPPVRASHLFQPQAIAYRDAEVFVNVPAGELNGYEVYFHAAHVDQTPFTRSRISWMCFS